MYAHRDRDANGARAPLPRPPRTTAEAGPLLSLSAMQTQAGNAATAAFLSGAAPVQRAPLTVQRVDRKGKRRERSPLTEEELRQEEEYQRALARQARAHERARARAEEAGDLPMGSMDDPFGGHTNKRGYKGDRGPLAVTNKVQHPGSSKFSERYYEDRPGKPSGFMSHLTDEDIGVNLDVLGNIPPDQDAIDRMDATRRRASSTLYGAASSEEQRHPGASKAMRSALRRQKSGKSLRKDFKDDFPMAGSSKYDGPGYGAQAFSKAQSGKTRLSRGAQETLLDMSDSSDDGRGRRPLREPEIVEERPRRRSMSVGPSSYAGRPEPAGPSSRHYPPSSSRMGPIPGGPSQPIIMSAEPPRERRRSVSRQGRSSSRPPERPLALRPAPASYEQNPYGAPPAPTPYRQSPYGGPPAPTPYRQNPYGAPPPRSEPVHMINGRPCVLRDGRWVAIG